MGCDEIKVSIQFDLSLQIEEILLPIPIHCKKKLKKADFGLSDLIYREKKQTSIEYTVGYGFYTRYFIAEGCI